MRSLNLNTKYATLLNHKARKHPPIPRKSDC